MFLLKEYHRAASLIRFYGYEKTDVLCLYLLAECLYEAKEYQEGLDVLMSVEIEDLGVTTTTVDQEGTLIHLVANEENKNVSFSTHVYKGLLIICIPCTGVAGLNLLHQRKDFGGDG